MFKINILLYSSFKKIYLLITCILLLICFSTVYAQGSGKITGVVVDKVNGDPLPGANVFLEGTAIGASTDIEGEYVMLSVPAGSYNLIVKYIGYKDVSMAITVVANETLVQVLEAEYVAIVGEAIEVTAQAEGQIAAINQQLSSNSITNVVSSDRIQDVPDANAAESVSRLPGISLQRSGGEGQKVTIRGLSPKYNVMQVNGVRMQSTDARNRSVDLNMIAPNILSGIEVTKALTADMDADAVGGTVNLKIGNAPRGFKGNYSLQGGFGSLAETYGNFRANALLSNRFLDDNLGVRVSGFLDNFDRSSDFLGAGWDINRNVGEGDLLLSELANVAITDNITDRQRFGGGLVLDYQFSNGSLVMNSFVSRLHQESKTVVNSLTTSTGFTASATLGESNNTVFNNALQGEFEFFNIGMDFSLSSSISKQDVPGNRAMTIYKGSGAGTIIPQELLDERDENNIPLVKRLEPHQFLNAITVDPNLFTNRFTTFKRDVTDAAQVAALNFNVPYNFTSWLSGNLKFGGKYAHNSRENNETLNSIAQRTEVNLVFMDSLMAGWWTDPIIVDGEEYWFTQDDGNTGARSFLFGDTDYDVGDFLAGQEGVSDFYFLPNFDMMKKFINAAKDPNHLITTTRWGSDHTAYFQEGQPSRQYDYDYSRNLSAFYIQTDMNIGNYVTLYPGVRYENYSMDYNAYYINRYGPTINAYTTTKLNTDSIKAMTGKDPKGLEGDNWFPQIQMRIKPVDWLDVRLASTKSILYPDYRAVSPYRYYNETASPLPTLELSNPFLKPAIAQNYDIYTSVYDNYIGLFTAGYFYKEVENLAVSSRFNSKDPAEINNLYPLRGPQNTEVTTWENLDATSIVRGIELDWQTHFWYLPSYFKGLVLNINYTHISSETKYPYQTSVRSNTFPPTVSFVDTTRAGRMPDQPNDIFNVTLGYDIGGFSARLSYVYQDDVITGINRNWEELDVYTDTFTRWDFTATQKLPWYEGLLAYLNINNISNEPDRRVVSTLKKLSRVEYYGLTTDLGLRYTF